ncbi:MAG: hypothetical protein FWF84_06125 [Kiritimatiellaeota bacterium]|nr:hypothetical protein [Kiritimatiellota bacterium]
MTRERELELLRKALKVTLQEIDTEKEGSVLDSGTIISNRVNLSAIERLKTQALQFKGRIAELEGDMVSQ